MEGGTEFDLKAIDADSEHNKNTGSDKQLNSRWLVHCAVMFVYTFAWAVWNVILTFLDCKFES